MNRIVLIFGLFFSVNFACAQSLAVTGDDYFTSNPYADIVHHLVLKNISANAITVVCQKTIISTANNLPSWAGASYCFAGNCYAASSTNPSTPALLSSGQSFDFDNNDLDAFSGYYTPAETPGITTVEYCFYDQNNPTDESCIIFTYDITSISTGIREMNKISEFYPNPAQGVVYVDYNLNQIGTLIIMDILGNKIKTIQLSEEGKQKVDISDFSKGIYFGNVILDNEVVTIKKIVVR